MSPACASVPPANPWLHQSDAQPSVAHTELAPALQMRRQLASADYYMIAAQGDAARLSLAQYCNLRPGPTRALPKGCSLPLSRTHDPRWLGSVPSLPYPPPCGSSPVQGCHLTARPPPLCSLLATATHGLRSIFLAVYLENARHALLAAIGMPASFIGLHARSPLRQSELQASGTLKAVRAFERRTPGSRPQTPRAVPLRDSRPIGYCGPLYASVYARALPSP